MVFQKIIYYLLSYLILYQKIIFSFSLTKFTANFFLFFEFSFTINSPILSYLLSSSERLIMAFRNCFVIYGA